MNKPVFLRRTHLLVFTLALLSTAAALLAKELPPGGLTNPEGLQRFQGVAYNSALDEYLLIYQGGDIPQVRRLDVEGALIGPPIPLDQAIGIANVGLVYNPDQNQYLGIQQQQGPGRLYKGSGGRKGGRLWKAGQRERLRNRCRVRDHGW